MRHTLMAGLTLGALLLALRCAGLAQALPVPGVEPARDVPGAKEMPDTKIVHKVVFDMATAGPKPGEVHPMLQAVARYVNTLAKTGVPEANRKIAVVFHQGATDYIMNNDAYKARHEGQDNPNARDDPGAEEGRRGLPGVRPGGARHGRSTART